MVYAFFGSKLDQSNLCESSILGVISFQPKMSSQGYEVLHLKLLLKSRRKMIHHVNFDLFYCKKSLTSFRFTVAIVSLEIGGFNMPYNYRYQYFLDIFHNSIVDIDININIFSENSLYIFMKFDIDINIEFS